MTVLTPAPVRRIRQRALVAMLDAAFTATPFALPYILGRQLFISAWLQLGAPFALFTLIRFLMLSARSSDPEIGWDHDGLQIGGPSERSTFSWAELAGHRLTWDIPRRLRLYRISGRDPVTLDIAAFDDEQREALMSEIARHSAVLSQGRLEPSRRMIRGSEIP